MKRLIVYTIVTIILYAVIFVAVRSIQYIHNATLQSRNLCKNELIIGTEQEQLDRLKYSKQLQGRSYGK